MNELEKTSAEEACVSSEGNVNVARPEESVAACVAASETEKECVETESPAEEIAAASDAVQAQAPADECVEKESPAQEIAAVADAQEEGTRRYYSMDKSQLLAELRAIVEKHEMNAHHDVAAIKQAYFSIRSKEIEAELEAHRAAGNDTASFVSTPDADETELKALLAEFKDKRAAYLEAAEKQRKENLEKKQEILEQMKAIVEDIDNINLNFAKFKQLEQEFKAIKEIPDGSVNDIWKAQQAVVELFYDRLKMNKDLRDLDFRKNLEAKRAIIEETQGLLEIPDVLAAFRRLQDLHAAWREIGPVAKDQREQIWDEFRSLSSQVHKRHQEFFESRKAEEQANEEAKEKLCQEIEALDYSQLKGFGAWDSATAKILDMQARWKTFGFASRKANNALFSRFRKACDEFFSAKAEHFRKTREEFAANLEKKTALCEKAEALKETADIKTGMQEVLKLQAEWKTIGSVARKQSDAIWARFTAACNYFYDARKKQASDTRKEETANLKTKRAIVDELKALAETEATEEGKTRVRELQNQWQQTGHVPFKQKDKLQEDYREAVKAVYDKFDMRGIRARMNRFENQVDEMRGDGSKLGRERDRLVRAYEQKRNELKTFENNMGFFNVKSSAGNSMVKEMENRIRRIREEMADIEKKISMVDENME